MGHRRSRILIVSDTMGKFDLATQVDWDAINKEKPVDLLIHCGNLTTWSQHKEYLSVMNMFAKLEGKTPQIVFVGGSHDFTLDGRRFEEALQQVLAPYERASRIGQAVAELKAHQLPERMRGTPADEKFEQRKKELLEKYAHFSNLTDGEAKLKNSLGDTYREPYTTYYYFMMQKTCREEANKMGVECLQYSPFQRGKVIDMANGTRPYVQASVLSANFRDGSDGHLSAMPTRMWEFDDPLTQILVTHGPPKSILDGSDSAGKNGKGDAGLFRVAARMRPLIHCFGNVSEGWGAKVVRWDTSLPLLNESENMPHPRITPENAIVQEESVVIEALGMLKDTTRHGCAYTSHCKGDARPLLKREDTLFINASMRAADGTITQRPWLVDVDLPDFDESDNEEESGQEEDPVE
ncbi:hypothetical protein OQA88_12344 [Cercophora sp. LCS_1]